MRYRLSIYSLLFAALLTLGCRDEKPEDETPPPPQDNAEAVAKLEHSGATLILDETTGNVVEVDFRDTNADGADLLALKGLVEVKRLLLTNCEDIREGDIAVIAQAPTIEVLDLRNCEVSNDSLADLAPLTKLRALRLAGKSGLTTVNDEGLAHLAGFENLQVLNLDGLWIGDEGLSHLTGLTKLRELTLASTMVDDSAMQVIIQLPQLEKLRLSQLNGLTDEGLALLPRLTKLKDLDLSEVTTFSNDGMEHIGKMTQLEKLNLWLTLIDDEGVEHLSGLVNLKWLNLDHTGLSDVGMPALADMTQLEFLHIGSTAVTDEGLEYLEGMSNLKKLMASRSGVTEEGAAQLNETLPDVVIDLEYQPGG